MARQQATTRSRRRLRRVGRTAKALEAVLAEGVLFPDPEEVRDYLRHYPAMVDLVPLVCRSVAERLGARAQLSLEVYHDPEIEDEYLTLYVRQQHYDEDIMDVIKSARAPYDAAYGTTPGWMLVTTDFEDPR